MIQRILIPKFLLRMIDLQRNVWLKYLLVIYFSLNLGILLITFETL